MRVLLDHCVPKQFGFLLTGHFMRTANYMGWDKLRNGELLGTCAAEFDVLLTVDGNLGYEQDAATLPLPVISLEAMSNDLPDLAPLAPEVLNLLRESLLKRVYIISAARGRGEGGK